MTIDNQVGLDGQNMVAPIDGTIGGGALGNGNGLSESTPQFGSGQPLTNPSMPGASDFLCKGWILSRLIDPLYNVYCEAKTSKQLWLALEKKYKSEDAGCQKYATAKFLNFKMVDSKPIMEQVEALQLITHEIAAEGMSICEIFTLRVESQNREADAVLTRTNDVNLAEQKRNGKGKVPPKPSTSFKKQGQPYKFAGKCHKCGKVGHKVDVCRQKAGPSEDKGKSQAYLTEADCALWSQKSTMLRTTQGSGGTTQVPLSTSAMIGTCLVPIRNATMENAY
ncbi:unnamed protein product [Microthlaspi erraticum]|uniref:CCHC-type domain-containing protein n=1 Tax=Microthlaspi erraticum TaxID=1685480 RepID=A0A6D2KC82_9BRAS|nr:unnamed protein product [Microthlaspi erraticum]